MNTLKSIKKSVRPLYDLAIDAVSDLINNGQFAPGDKLPPETELAEQLGISRSTLREAIGYLESRGVVHRKHGVGLFVAHPIHKTPQRGLDEVESLLTLANKLHVSYRRRVWKVGLRHAQPEVAQALALPPDAPVVQVEMVVDFDNQPYAYLNGFIQPELVDLPTLSFYPQGSFLDYLFDRHQLDVSHTYSRVLAVTASHEIAQTMSIPLNFPLLHLVETYKSQGGSPLVYTLNYFDTQVLNFFINRRIIHP
jgi:GntR family transcriptional regulator